MSLTELFARQARFAHPTSPLMASLSLAMARAVEEPRFRGQYEGLVSRVASPNPHEPALRLAAALHEWVLLEDERAATVRPYYASVGVPRPAGEQAVDDFEATLREHGLDLCEHADEITIQTNETSRGIVWLLVTALASNLDDYHLVELGGSAGLNLLAEQRHYAFNGGVATLGSGASPDLEIDAREVVDDLGLLHGRRAPAPSMRWCIDRAPLDATDPSVGRRLLACVWGDQQRRIAALRRGLALAQSGPELRRLSAEFPDELPAALESVPPDRPLVLFHTYARAYLGSRAGAFDDAVAAHVAAWPHLAISISFEPVHDEDPTCVWTVRVRGETHQLARAHPHLSWARFERGALVTLAEALS